MEESLEDYNITSIHFPEVNDTANLTDSRNETCNCELRSSTAWSFPDLIYNGQLTHRFTPGKLKFQVENAKLEIRYNDLSLHCSVLSVGRRFEIGKHFGQYNIE